MRVTLFLSLATLATPKWRTLIPFLAAAGREDGSHAMMMDVGSNDGEYTSFVMKSLCSHKATAAPGSTYGTQRLCCDNQTNQAASSITFVTFEPQVRFHDTQRALAFTSRLGGEQSVCPSHNHEFLPVAAWTSNANLSFVQRRYDRRHSNPRFQSRSSAPG